MAVSLLLFGVIVYMAMRRALVRELDASLLGAAHAIATTVELDAEGIEVEIARGPGLQAQRLPFHYQLSFAGGIVFMRSPSLGDDQLPISYGEDGRPSFRDLRLPDGRPGRAMGIQFAPPRDYEEEHEDQQEDEDEDAGEARHVFDLPVGESHPLITLVVAGSAAEVRQRLELIRLLLLAAGAATMLVSVSVSLVIAGRGLGPLTSLARRISAIREDGLPAQVTVERVPEELAPVVQRLNDLLDRLAAALGRERAFTADVGHELRTPLAGARTTLEVALSKPRDPDEYREALNDCLAIVTRMHAMVESLLLLSRLESGQMTQRRELVRLARAVDACWQPVARRAEARGLQFDNGIPPDATCVSDPQGLAVVFTNLLENAVEYAEDGGRIWASADRVGRQIDITIANTGCQLTTEQAARVFERFWRADNSRRDTGVHYGLGLTLVRRMIRFLGGEVSSSAEEGGVFAIRIRLPGGDGSAGARPSGNRRDHTGDRDRTA